MNHIPLPRDRNPFVVDVPLLARDVHRYDGQGFYTFPARSGFTEVIIDDNRTPDEIQSFTQAWLFFGTLREIFGSEFQQDDFIYEHVSGRQIIDTTLLPTYIDSFGLPHLGRRISRWNILASLRRRIVTLSSRARIQEVLQCAHHAAQSLDRDLGAAFPAWPALMLSIRVLLESLQNLGNVRLDMQLIESQPSARLIMEYLSTSPGWCKHQVADVCSSNSYVAALYLANLERHPRKWTSHDECVFHDRCAAFNIENETYESKHISPGCQCEHITAPTEDMLHILATDGIPVLRCEYVRDGSLSLCYVRASPGAQYAAVSHLWTDGIGNANGNTLPECRIRRIASYVTDANDLLFERPDNSGVQASPIKFSTFFNTAEKLFSGLDDHPIDFWLDAYCVPVVQSTNFEQPEEGSKLLHLKTVALSRMFATYAWARYTLVLDHELLSMASQAEDTELYARIAFCGWNTRCWTFQEYCLASKVIFQCDRARLRQRRAKTYWKSNDALLNVFWRMCKPEYIFTGARQEIGYADDETRAAFSDDAAFATVWNYLVKRNTTKWQDVPGIFANLLGLSAAELAGLQPGDVMKAIIATKRPLPLSILYIETTRSSSETIPRSLKDLLNSGMMIPDDLWVPLAPLGERLSQCPTLAVQDGGLVLPRKGIQHMFRILWPKAHTLYCVHNHRSYSITLREILPQQPRASDEVMVVFCSPDFSNCDGANRGFLLLPKEQSIEKILHTTYLGTLQWSECAQDTIKIPGIPIRHADELEREKLTVLIDCSKPCPNIRVPFTIVANHTWTDIAGWQRGSLDRAALRASRRTAFTYLRPLFYFGLFIGLCLTLLIYLICILVPSLSLAQAYAVSIITALIYLLFTLPFTLSVTYTIYEVWDYITLSQAIADRRDEATWAENVESAMPRERLGVSFYRYWIVCSILRVLILGDKISRVIIRISCGERRIRI